ncbi:MAG: hypothetical protein COB35_12770 [Gammaproteobacteria bacterium]|nr:MAG: hypothetical protein COB35_12770 [Gammaproteobacteria bacterium]
MEELLTAVSTKNWSGLKDDLKEGNQIQEKVWPLISALNSTSKKCNNCPNKKNCGFVKERSKIKQADVIIANHALIWSDITHNNVLPDPTNALYIFDEAHHIPKNYRSSLNKSFNFKLLDNIFSTQRKNTLETTKNITELSETCPTLTLEHANILCENSTISLTTLFEHCKFYLLKNKNNTMIKIQPSHT